MPLIPQIPTDNLYKFIALAGLAAVLITGYLQIQAATAEDQWQRDESTASELRAKEFDAITDAYDSHKALGADSAMRATARFWDSTIRTGDSVRYAHLNDWYKWRVALQSGALDWSWRIGWLLTIAGFCLWYWKVQRYLDRQLRAQFTTED